MNDTRKITRVRDVMKSHFDIVDGLDTVETALKRMQYTETKCLIVDKRHEDDEYGILLISDIARNVLAKDLPPQRVNVYEVMAKPAISVDPQMDIRFCARLFDRCDLSRAPVVENGKVIGIISLTDLVLKGMVATD